MIRRDFNFFILVCLCLLGFSCSLQNKYGTVTFALPENSNSSGKTAARGVGELPLGDALPENYTIKLTPNVGKIIEIEGKAGQNVVIANLVPGDYEVIVEGKIDQFLYHGKTNVVVESGKTAEARLELYKSEIKGEGGEVIPDPEPTILTAGAAAAKITNATSDSTFKVEVTGVEDFTTLCDAIKATTFNIELDIVPSGGWEKVSSGAFFGCTNLSKVILEEGFASIEYQAFQGCKALTTVTLPAGLTILGADVFKLSGITEMIIPEGVKTINAGTFDSCKSLTSVTIPDSVEEIKAGAFLSNNSLNNVILPKDSVWLLNRAKTGQSDMTFEASTSDKNAQKINEAVLQERNWRNMSKKPLSVTEFNGLKKPSSGCVVVKLSTKDVIADFVKSLGDLNVQVILDENVILQKEFNQLPNLTKITIPSSVTTIVANAFKNCSNLNSIVWHNGITDIGANAFEGCKNLKNIELPTNLESIGTAVFQNSGVTSIDLPLNLTTIPASAFQGCTGLESVCIRDNVSQIESMAFSGCTNLTYADFMAYFSTWDVSNGGKTEVYEISKFSEKEHANKLKEGGVWTKQP